MLTKLRSSAMHMVHTVTGLSPLVYLFAVGSFMLPFVTSDFYLMELVVIAILFALFAASWDILCGYTDQPSFGHALFIGGAGYIAAILNRNFDFSPWVTVPLSASIVAVLGAFIGVLTLRLRGPYFALATIAFSAAFYRLIYIQRPTTGGDEGLTGVDPFTFSVEGDLQITVSVFLVSVILLSAFARSHYGLILRTTRHNEEAAQASGINTAYYKIVGFAVSAFFAGIAGALYTHTHMQITPGMAAGGLSVLVVLMATIGGAGTLVGPILIAALLAYFNQWLRIVEEYRMVLFMGTLVALIYLYPKGLANAPWLKRAPSIRRLLLGRD
ncbi:branched-chain amino acid transport system permease protein [Natronocella acetinitrilica]|uniref:Branched-chain amino acid transport system permease protein n=2 Tax=Natronocella acetinitrilica TaxID=414046 RepID=A0AAE3KES3_9GAMM|nr:branched-chain amino acid transport system permease protein [Natronocella acetinitrilica]